MQLKFGALTLAELMQRVGGLKGLAYWRAVWKVCPWGEYLEEKRHGQMMALMAAANGVKKVKPSDFMNFRIGDRDE